MPGRKKEPVSVLKIKGKSHYSNEYLEEREKAEAKIAPKECTVPEDLTDTQKRIFLKTYSELAEYGLITHLETSMLVRFCKAKEEYDKISKAIENMEIGDAYIKLMNTRFKLSDELRRCESELGLTMFSRMKMAVPKEEEKPKTEAEVLFGEI